MRVHIDFETRSRADIKKVGLHRYAEDESTDVLCLGYAFNDDPAQIWVINPYKPPTELINKILAGYEVHAWNVAFEEAIWNTVCTYKYGWPDIHPDQLRDTMASAAAMSLPLALADCAKTMKTAEKMSSGTRLITKLCKPFKGHFREYKDFTQDFLDLYAYCQQDVEAERALYHKLNPLTPKEYRVWRHCFDMNKRGLPVDPSEVDTMVDLVQKQKDRLNAKLPMLTKGKIRTANQTKEMLKWVRSQKMAHVENVTALTVRNLLASDKTPDRVKRVLKIRQDVSKSSTAKFKRAQQQVCQDNTIKDTLLYHGAGTGRYAGRNFQLQNLIRGSVDNPDAVMNFLMTQPLPVINIYCNLIDMATLLIRPIIKAPRGMKMVIGDFHMVEAIATPWIAGEQKLLDAIRNGLDLYTEIASRMFGIPYEVIDKIQRQAGKITVLAAGFAGGAQALIGMAENYGIAMPINRAEGYIQRFRVSRPELVDCWRQFHKAACAALSRPEAVHRVNVGVNIYFRMEGEHLKMKLPSGRDITYPFAHLAYGKTPWGSSQISPHYSTKIMNDWGQRSMTGGNFFQNAVQGTCRDLLVDAQLNLEAAGYPVFLSVHDEIGCLVPDEPKYNLKKFIDIMTLPPTWAAGFPISADGYESNRYRK